ncbi:FecR family protein [Stakelama sediminis]|uniref:Transmembrane sensor n=1 Tax=Stakelama sediminis TaxID=463200 RepID=A0A840YYC8_9SPHN|nr:FecR domain-containing protein [Stakelama sediminis]MBB5718539.1 transmembrane sensor [Stakelama sediminis]
MSNVFSPDALEAARHWAIRLRDPDFADWDGFTEWLESDPQHSAAYDATCDMDEDIGALFAVPAEPVPDLQPYQQEHPRRGVLRWIGAAGAVAACAALAVGIGRFEQAPATRLVETGPGKHRTVQLADGTRIALNGGTRLTVSADSRTVTIERGEALFRVHHDAARPFTVQAGNARLVDIGTVFDVVKDKGPLRVSVASGAVMYDPGGQAIRVDAGHALTVSDSRAILSSVTGDSVGSWRHGTLVFNNASLQRVAQDMARSLGTPIQVDPTLADSRFTGTLAINGDAATIVPRVAPLLGVRALHTDNGWNLVRADHAAP